MQKKSSLDYDLIILGSGPAVSAAETLAKAENKRVAIFPHATFVSPYEISLDKDQKKLLAGKSFLLALPAQLKTSGISFVPAPVKTSPLYLSPAAVLRLTSTPGSVCVVGAGSTGCELAQHFASLGASVTLVESAARLLPCEDEEVGLLLQKYFRSVLKIKVLTQSRVSALAIKTTTATSPASTTPQSAASSQTLVTYLRGGKPRSLSVDLVILATGYEPDPSHLSLENAGVNFTESGITVDDFLRTSARHIFAAGDCLGGELSPERAAYEGSLAFSNLFHRTKNLRNYEGFIRLTRTYPSVSSVGLTEDDCIKQGIAFEKSTLPLTSVSSVNLSSLNSPSPLSSLVSKSSPSNSVSARLLSRFCFAKLLIDKKHKILGATVVAPHSELLMQEIATAVRHKLSLDTLAATPHVSSSLSELIHQTARCFFSKNTLK